MEQNFDSPGRSYEQEAIAITGAREDRAKTALNRADRGEAGSPDRQSPLHPQLGILKEKKANRSISENKKYGMGSRRQSRNVHIMGSNQHRSTSSLGSYIAGINHKQHKRKSASSSVEDLKECYDESEINVEKERADKYRNMMDQLRYKYFKDLINVRAYAEKLESQLKIGAANKRPKELNQSIEEVLIKNIQLFDSTEGIDLGNTNKELLNDKIQRLARDFNERLIKLSLQNHLLRAQITKYRILNENPAGGQKAVFDINDIDTASMVKKLLVVSDDAQDVWYHFNAQQPGFFLRVLMEEYGIDQSFSKKVMKDFHEQAKDMQERFDEQLREVSHGFQTQIAALTLRNQELIKEAAATRLKIGPAIDALRDKIHKQLLKSYDEQIEEFLRTKTQQIKYK